MDITEYSDWAALKARRDRFLARLALDTRVAELEQTFQEPAAPEPCLVSRIDAVETRLRISVASDGCELERIQRFRAEIYERAGWRVADHQGLDRDAYDQTGVTLVAYQMGDGTGEIVGTVRITEAVADRFMIEDHGWRVPGWFPRATCREISRWAVRPRRGARTSLWLAMAAALWMREQATTHALCILPPHSLRALSRTPLRLFGLGPATTVCLYGRESVIHPTWIPVPQSIPMPPRGVELAVA